MKTLDNVLSALKNKNVEFSKTEHEPVRTSEEAAKLRGVELKSGVKAMLLKKAEGGFVMVLIEADKRIDLKKIAELEKTKKLSFANMQEVVEETGAEPGGVPPFGYTKNGEPNKIKTYMDKNILNNEAVNFNAGDSCISVSMKGKDLDKVVDYIPF